MSKKYLKASGAINVVKAAPAFPAPKIPSAVPCFLLGYQTDEKAIPMEKLTPTSPKPELQSANPVKLLTVDKDTSGPRKK